MKLLGIEIVIHKKPIKYDPMNHFKDVIDERLDKIEDAKKRFKKVLKIYSQQREDMISGGDEVDIIGLFKFACGVEPRYHVHDTETVTTVHRPAK